MTPPPKWRLSRARVLSDAWEGKESLLEGYLKKRSRMGQWQHRYFRLIARLDGGDRTVPLAVMQYYGGPEDGAPRGAIVFAEGVSDCGELKRYKSGLVFEVRNVQSAQDAVPRTSVELEAPSEAERHSWISAIKSALRSDPIPEGLLLQRTVSDPTPAPERPKERLARSRTSAPGGFCEDSMLSDNMGPSRPPVRRAPPAHLELSPKKSTPKPPPPPPSGSPSRKSPVGSGLNGLNQWSREVVNALREESDDEEDSPPSQRAWPQDGVNGRVAMAPRPSPPAAQPHKPQPPAMPRPPPRAVRGDAAPRRRPSLEQDPFKHGQQVEVQG